jgi:hypothetical protein
MLLTAVLARFRPRGLVALALLSALIYDVTPSLLLIPYRLDNRPAAEQFWRPAVVFLGRHELECFRVEVVPTAAHWESYWIPQAGFALARGWYRQIDMADNPILYSGDLTEVSYVHWLRSATVDYVLLPETELDPVEGVREARILRSHSSQLTEVYRSKNWRIYRVDHPMPLISGPGRSRIVVFSHTRIGGVVGRPGRYLLRVHFNPFWDRSDNVCAVRGPADMTWLDASAAGAFSLKAASVSDVLLRAVLGGLPCRPAVRGEAGAS